MTANQGENIQYKYNTQGLVTEVHHNNIKRVAFFYDERGQRVKKISYDTTGTTAITTDYYIRDLSGNVMSIYNSSIGNNNTITQTELPIYGGSRLGVYTRNDTTQYQITDHLGNVRAVIEKNTQNPLGIDQTDYSDYYPFGEKLPMRNMFSKYRYAFQGQELDPETGMEAFQLRLWDGRIGRWLTTDPYGQYHSPYLGMGNNPISRIDPDGGSTDDIIFRNNDGKELARIIMEGPDINVNIDTNYTTDKPIVINPSKIAAEENVFVSAIGLSFEYSGVVGGGLEFDNTYVFYLGGQNKGELHSYVSKGGGVGLDGGIGVSPFYSTFLGEQDSPFYNANGFAGGYNGYSISLIASTGISWSNEKGTHNELYPGHRYPTTWISHILPGYSRGVHFGAKWSGGTMHHITNDKPLFTVNK
ncbi:MAG: RHS repeat-associated core domain-containing protein [Flavobacteriales bacterium]|nr:RHS repeat-associated core domain-containing protein [Flavobacteriales bacterium]